MIYNTGDLLLLSCTTNIFSRLIEYFTNSPYSHCGIIIKDPKFTPKPMVGNFFLESGSESFPDAENHKIKIGVELVDLDEMISKYPGKIVLRKLDCNRNEEFYSKLSEIHKVIHNKPYDLDPIDWIKALIGDNSGNTQLTNRFWCSALVSYIYVQLGLLDKDTPWSLITPNDLSSSGKKLQFINCSLGSEIQIK